MTNTYTHKHTLLKTIYYWEQASFRYTIAVRAVITCAHFTISSWSTCVAQAEVWPYHCWRVRLFTLATSSAAGGVQGQFTDLQVSPASSSIISGWDVHSRLSNRQPMSQPLCNLYAIWQFHESDWQDMEEEVLLCLVRWCGTHYHWLSVMCHWRWLSSAHDWRLFCFQ